MNSKSFILIAGPCLLEDETVAKTVAKELQLIQEDHSDLQIIFKASLDKANRSSVKSFRGNGIDEGLEILQRIHGEFGFPITTDFHEPAQAAKMATVCDILQIPAFLCRQTDMLRAAAETGKAVSVKKGQFLSPWDMRQVIEKLETFGAKMIYPIERGSSFGYGDLLVDMRSFPIMRQFGRPVIYDLTHSLQKPGKGDGITHGCREFADPLARAAIAAGIDGIFIETHPDPSQAKSDAETQLPLTTLRRRLRQYMKLWRQVRDLAEDL